MQVQFFYVIVILTVKWTQVFGYDSVTIKEALAAAALSLGNKLLDSRDTAAIDRAMDEGGQGREFRGRLSKATSNNTERITVQKLLEVTCYDKVSANARDL